MLNTRDHPLLTNLAPEPVDTKEATTLNTTTSATTLNTTTSATTPSTVMVLTPTKRARVERKMFANPIKIRQIFDIDHYTVKTVELENDGTTTETFWDEGSELPAETREASIYYSEVVYTHLRSTFTQHIRPAHSPSTFAQHTHTAHSRSTFMKHNSQLPQHTTNN
jgi:hypothetical protein